ncbi:hypothetical protein QE410_002861 [Microbacterium sp. SORGH_AS 1204]|uniref:LamG domain-containing protein n=1 Tax=Microbacterium sp. SORGH_AS_1204 TaxID=3041785 RepID=UPI00278E8CC3|nr:LamG domain-containing protein [Microbacterium sp. SORGH_AS_1204]MDQ1138062.1 hypothetical protein [Microbacterium sp. SORGH_AS_1204]
MALWIRPWFNVRLLDYRPSSDGDGVLMHVVNTGLLPILAGSTRLLSGQAASVLSTDRLENGAYTLAPVADPDWLVRLLLVAICLLPFLCGLLARPSDPLPSPMGLRSRPDRRAARIVVPAGILTVVAVVVLVTVSTSTAAFNATIRNSTDSAGTNPFFTCRGAETSVGKAATWAAFALSQGPSHEPDLSGNGRHGTWASPNTTSNDVGCVRDAPAASAVFSGSQCLYVPTWQNNPNVFGLEAWFSTTTAPSGKIIGFGDGFLTPNDPYYWDRHIFLDDSGRVVFGLFSNGFVRLTSPPGTSYADGEWHSVIANLSAAGAQLFVDGVLVDQNPSVTIAQNYGGYWRIGCGRLTYWSSAPDTFTGLIQYAAIYRRPLTALEAQQHAAAGR